MATVEILDISGDVGLEVQADDLYDLFEGVASGMFGLITNTADIQEKTERRITIHSRDIDNLVIAWLNELIFIFDTDGLVPRRYEFYELTEDSVDGRIVGEEFNPQIHERRLLIKAATYHDFEIKRIGSMWWLKVIFDI